MPHLRFHLGGAGAGAIVKPEIAGRRLPIAAGVIFLLIFP
jgi:hypothetical protein